MRNLMRSLAVITALALAASAQAATSGMGATFSGNVLNHGLRATAWSAPTNLYGAIFHGTPPTTDALAQTAVSTAEVTGGAYARLVFTNGTGVWNAPSAGATANTAQLTWAAAPTADWCTTASYCTWVALMDVSTLNGGNIFIWAQLTSQTTQILNGQAAPYIAAGAFTISVARVWEAAKDLFARTGRVSPLLTVFGDEDLFAAAEGDAADVALLSALYPEAGASELAALAAMVPAQVELPTQLALR